MALRPACLLVVVPQLVVDVSCGHRVHSSGEDCMVLSYDLRTERRYNIHTVRSREQADRQAGGGLALMVVVLWCWCCCRCVTGRSWA